MYTQTPRPSFSQSEAEPVTKPHTPGYNLRSLQVILGVAFVLATLFTAWTPGQFQTPQAFPYYVTQPASPATPASVAGGTTTPRTRLLIGIVAGHWKNDSGAVCSDGLTEVEVNLNIATLVQKILVEKGFDVDLLSEFDPRLNNYQASALVSIHNDSCDYINNQATGFKVAAAMASRNPERAARLTACLRSRYSTDTGLPLHSTSVTPDMASYHAFDEINENTPASIIEAGFLNLDRQFLTQNPDIAAQGIADGILCFIRNESITPPTSVPTCTP
jgi:N-acetylmuramoyl-L-alanine amidase